jgi:hypothetical protein
MFGETANTTSRKLPTGGLPAAHRPAAANMFTTSSTRLHIDYDLVKNARK